MRRPLSVTVPAALLLVAPLLQLAAVRFDVAFLNFGELRPAAYLIYGIAAPLIG